MKEYTRSELEDLNRRRLHDAAECISEGDHEFTEEQQQLISKGLKRADNKLQLRKENQEDIDELLKIAEQQSYEIYPEQLEALKWAFIAFDLEAWKQCRTALEIYFDWENEEDIKNFDLSKMSLRNLLRWLKMLEHTNLGHEPNWKAARALRIMIEDQIVNTFPYPKDLCEGLKDALKHCTPEMMQMFQNSKVDKEKRIVHFNVEDAAKAFNMSKEELIREYKEVEKELWNDQLKELPPNFRLALKDYPGGLSPEFIKTLQKYACDPTDEERWNRINAFIETHMDVKDQARIQQ